MGHDQGKQVSGDECRTEVANRRRGRRVYLAVSSTVYELHRPCRSELKSCARSTFIPAFQRALVCVCDILRFCADVSCPCRPDCSDASSAVPGALGLTVVNDAEQLVNYLIIKDGRKLKVKGSNAGFTTLDDLVQYVPLLAFVFVRPDQCCARGIHVCLLKLTGAQAQR